MPQNNRSKNPLINLILLLAAMTAISPLAVDMYLPAMLDIASTLNTDIKIVQQSISLYLAAFSVGMLFFGPLADHFNRKNILFLGLFGFICSSVLISQAKSIESFLLFRACQAFFGSVTAVIVPNYVRQAYGDNTAKGMSYVLFVMMLAPLIAPSLGSAILAISSWQYIFLFLAAYGLLLIPLLFFKLMPEEPNKNHQLKSIAFLNKYQDVLKTPNIIPSLTSSMMAGFGFFGYLTASPIIYMQIFKLDHGVFSFLFAINTISLMIANFVNGKIVESIGSRSLLKMASLSAILISFLLILTSSMNYPWLSMALIIPLVGLFGMISVNADSILIVKVKTGVSSASALMGILKFAMGATAGPLLALFYDGTIIPFAILMAISSGYIFINNLIYTQASSRC